MLAFGHLEMMKHTMNPIFIGTRPGAFAVNMLTGQLVNLTVLLKEIV